ncbi:MAG: cysteine methyltransferase [Bacteroidota bacterium]|nr:cysteine methyltransferase [Bacteroidota bacterium]
MDQQFTTSFTSPIGIIEISGTSDFISEVMFVDEAGETEEVPEILSQCKTELQEYFAGKRKEFTITTDPDGTDFQKSVWAELCKVGYGDKASYLRIANMLKNPGAVRAVGLANGNNPVAIIIPCHRIIGENGKLTGYAGGLWRKKWLLELEGNVSGKSPTLF